MLHLILRKKGNDMELLIDQIEKSFDEKKVLQGASFTFEKGKIYSLLGRNGAGKTTLFNCISREIEYEAGNVILREAGEILPFDYHQIGYAFSIPVLPEFLTGYEFIKFYLDINSKRIQNPLTVEEYAQMVGLELSDLDCLLKGYSHGMKNKIQMLCLLISRPPVILLDEPLTSLDVVAAHEMKEMLLAMKKDHIIILSTHILQLAQDLSDEIVLLHQGKLSGVEDFGDKGEDFEEKIMAMLTQ
jgi:ABC-2 type transport system ATP-binding protein